MSAPQINMGSDDPFTVVLSDCSPEEWNTRVDLAALYHLACIYGWTDLTATHFSARIPGDPDHFILNSFDLLFDEITASNLCKFTFGGDLLTEGRVKNEAGYIIHSNVLKARPDVNFVMHTHTRAGMAVSAMEGGLRPLSQHAGEVLGTISSHPYQDSTVVENEGELLGRDLGENYLMLLENHGILAVGRTAAEVFWYHYMLEMACKIQIDVLHATDKGIEISPEACAPLIEYGKPESGLKGENQWPALIRMLDRKHPEFRK
jgi:ribulose-5-phosphate 4-epimerase/fuculose-1-phosphate aldolase